MRLHMNMGIHAKRLEQWLGPIVPSMIEGLVEMMVMMMVIIMLIAVMKIVFAFKSSQIGHTLREVCIRWPIFSSMRLVWPAFLCKLRP